jgi:hypothetical protein
MEIQAAEKDAGKEILYQVTQQAFNELLDNLFKEKESQAIKAAESKKDRDLYRHIFSTPWFEKAARQNEAERIQLKGLSKSSSARARGFIEPEHVRERSLEELLETTGYSIEDENHENPPPQIYEDSEPEIDSLYDRYPLRRVESHDSSITPPEQLFHPTILSRDDFPIGPPTPPAQDSPPRDPTMPQFRPDTPTPTPTPDSPAEEEEAEDKEIPVDKRPPPKYLFELWRKEQYEKEAKERGGWGQLDCDEFLALVKEGLANGGSKVASMEYLGSWIEFCIPH